VNTFVVIAITCEGNETRIISVIVFFYDDNDVEYEIAFVTISTADHLGKPRVVGNDNDPLKINTITKHNNDRKSANLAL
jgi:hypothetical protein